MKLVALSDTHCRHRDVTVPDGDVLIYAGDLMGSGYRHSEVKDFADWFMKQPHKHKILVAGNHDRLFESDLSWCLKNFDNVTYLQDSGCEIEGIKFWGSPVQPEFCNWAFNVPRGTPIKRYWDMIPEDTDVLITHGPPHGVLDQMIPGVTERPEGYPAHFSSPFEHLGCEELKKVVDRISPKVHIFGHIHGSHGILVQNGTVFRNVAICDEQYKPVNSPQVIEL